MAMKQDELECYAVKTGDHSKYNCKFFVAVLAATGYSFFSVCNATRFDSREELEINLQLKFPGCNVSQDIAFTCLDEAYNRITGILQRDMQESVRTGKGLI